MTPPARRREIRRIPTAALALALALPLGCGEGDLEEQLERASQTVAEARAQVEESREAVRQRKEAVTEAESALERARSELEAARAELAEDERELDRAEERIYGGETDALLFRAVQHRLLEDDALKGEAVAAQVTRGRVTLRGDVSHERERDRAVKIARETPGVVEVIDEMRVRGPKPQPASKGGAGSGTKGAAAEGEAS